MASTAPKLAMAERGHITIYSECRRPDSRSNNGRSLKYVMSGCIPMPGQIIGEGSYQSTLTIMVPYQGVKTSDWMLDIR